MKNNRYEDERVKQQRLKIGNEALILLMIFLMVSVLYQQFLLDASFKEYRVEFIGWLGASLYILIRNIFAGNNIFTNLKSKSLFIIPIICALSATAASFIMNRDYHLSGENIVLSIVTLLITFVISGVGAFAATYIIKKLNEKQSKKLEEKYDH